MPPIPYVFTEIPNKRLNHTAVAVNAGGARAWRAPNHPQASFLTCAAPNAGAIFSALAPFQERHRQGLGADQMIALLRQRLAVIEDAFIITIKPPPVRGIGTAGGFKMYVEDREGRGHAHVSEDQPGRILAEVDSEGRPLLVDLEQFFRDEPVVFLEGGRNSGA